MSSESKNQARWRKLEPVVLSFDGFVIFVSVAVVLFLALLALIDQVARFRNVYALIAGISFTLLAVSFVPPYLGMRRRIRWRWILHLLPLLTLLVLGPLIQQLMPSTRFGHVNKFYRNGSAGMEPTLLNGEFIGARL